MAEDWTRAPQKGREQLGRPGGPVLVPSNAPPPTQHHAQRCSWVHLGECTSALVGRACSSCRINLVSTTHRQELVAPAGSLCRWPQRWERPHVSLCPHSRPGGQRVDVRSLSVNLGSRQLSACCGHSGISHRPETSSLPLLTAHRAHVWSVRGRPCGSG